MTCKLFVNVLKVLRMLSQITYLTITFHIFSPPAHRPHQLFSHHSYQSSWRLWPFVVQTGHQCSVRFCYRHSLASSTRELYIYWIQRYLQFCNLINHPPLPISEQILLLFTTHLALQHLSTSIIQTYLSAVHYLHLSTNHLKVCIRHLTNS